MSNDNNGSAVTDQNVSDNGQTNQGDSQPIKREDHIRAVEDLKKFKAQARDFETKYLSLQNEIESLKTQKLTETNDYKSLYEQAATKNKDLETRYSKLKENVVYNEKFKAAQQALLEAGMKREAIKILEKEALDEILVEHTSEGRMLLSGVDEFKEKFRNSYQFAFEDKTKARVNGGGGGGGMTGEKVTADHVIAVEKKHGRGSAEYANALNQYVSQRNKK